MNDELITIIAFVVVVFGIGWYFWPKTRVVEPKLDPVPEPAPAPVVEEVVEAPVVEAVVEAPVVEAVVEAPVAEEVVEETPKAE